MAENSDQLRERLKSARTAGTTESGENDRPTTHSTGRTASDYVGVSNQPGNGTGQSTEPTLSDGGKPVRQFIGTVRGSSSGSGTTDRAASITKGRITSSPRGTTQDDRRVRSELRRPGEDHAKDRPDGIDVPASITGRGSELTGRLERTPGDEQFIPKRKFDGAETNTSTDTQETYRPTEPIIIKRGRGRPRKSGVAQVIGQFGELAKNIGTPNNDREDETFPGKERKNPLSQVKETIANVSSTIPKGNRLSAGEVKSLKEPLSNALTDEFELLDRMLWGYAGDGIDQPIWSDITEREMEAFVDSFLKLGTKSGTAAVLARSAIDMNDYIVVGGMLVPRIKATVAIMRSKRKNKGKR
jgi:hypothetical protein